MTSTIDASALVSAMRREKSSPSATPSGGEAPATAVVVVAGAAAPITAAAAAAPAAANIIPLGRQDRPLNPAGPWDLCPRPLDLASSCVGCRPLAAGRLRLDLLLQEVHHSLVPLRQRVHRVFASDVELPSDVGQDRAGIDHLEAAEALGEQEILVIGPVLCQVFAQPLLEARGVSVGGVLQLVTAGLPQEPGHRREQK